MDKFDQDHNSHMLLSRLHYATTIHRRLSKEMLSKVLEGDLDRIWLKAKMLLDLSRANRTLKRAIRDLSDQLYDDEFGGFSSLERRLIACERSLSAHIHWMDEQEDLDCE